MHPMGFELHFQEDLFIYRIYGYDAGSIHATFPKFPEKGYSNTFSGVEYGSYCSGVSSLVMFFACKRPVKLKPGP